MKTDQPHKPNEQKKLNPRRVKLKVLARKTKVRFIVKPE